MTTVVHRPIGEIGDALAVIDAGRRVYVGASRDGSYLHVVSPLQVELVDPDGNVIARVGELACSTCKGGTYRGGECYRARQARELEANAAAAVAAPSWFGEPEAVAS